MQIQESIQLQTLNTMATPAVARWFAVVQTVEELLEALAFCEEKQCDYLVLGDGSNTLFESDMDLLVIANRIGGAGQNTELFSSSVGSSKGSAIKVIAEDDTTIEIKVGAGINWHEFVSQSVAKGYSGIETLALIPGLIGAAPIQNIGAYGTELKDCLVSVGAVEVANRSSIILSNSECEFAYRDSLFKRDIGRYIITDVTLRLSKENPIYRRDDLYKGLQTEFSVDEVITPEKLFAAVCRVRNAKLPSPQKIPNAGSFFKNPVVDVQKYKALKQKHAELVAFPYGEDFKLAAAWLIDHLGYKGEELPNGVGNYEKQALVIVNRNKVSGKEVLAFAHHLQTEVMDKYAVQLEIEPRVYASASKRLISV